MLLELARREEDGAHLQDYANRLLARITEAQPHMLDSVTNWLDRALQNGHKHHSRKHSCSKQKHRSSSQSESHNHGGASQSESSKQGEDVQSRVAIQRPDSQSESDIKVHKHNSQSDSQQQIKPSQLEPSLQKHSSQSKTRKQNVKPEQINFKEDSVIVTKRPHIKRDYMQDSGYISGPNAGDNHCDNPDPCDVPLAFNDSPADQPTNGLSDVWTAGDETAQLLIADKASKRRLTTHSFSVEAEVHSSCGLGPDSEDCGETVRLLGTSPSSKPLKQAKKMLKGK